jgi:hypothetical protein
VVLNPRAATLEQFVMRKPNDHAEGADIVAAIVKFEALFALPGSR